MYRVTPLHNIPMGAVRSAAASEKNVREMCIANWRRNDDY